MKPFAGAGTDDIITAVEWTRALAGVPSAIASSDERLGRVSEGKGARGRHRRDSSVSAPDNQQAPTATVEDQ